MGKTVNGENGEWGRRMLWPLRLICAPMCGCLPKCFASFFSLWLSRAFRWMGHSTVNKHLYEKALRSFWGRLLLVAVGGDRIDGCGLKMEIFMV